MATNPQLPTTLTLDISTANQCTRVACHGIITAETSPSFAAALRRVIPRSSCVIVDLADVNYMDSAGLGSLMAVYATSRKASCDFRLLNLSTRVAELLRTARLTSILKIEGNLL
jgi:anti-sigma B factor antagonist